MTIQFSLSNFDTPFVEGAFLSQLRVTNSFVHKSGVLSLIFQFYSIGEWYIFISVSRHLIIIALWYNLSQEMH